MRKEFSGLRIDLVREALREMGYEGRSYFDGFSWSFDSWKKGQTHVIMRERKPRVVVLNIHSGPPFHVGRTRVKGSDLEVEFKLIFRHTLQSLRNRSLKH